MLSSYINSSKSLCCRLNLFQNVRGQSIKKIKDLEMALLKSIKIGDHIIIPHGLPKCLF